jgi:hypothetical protein
MIRIKMTIIIICWYDNKTVWLYDNDDNNDYDNDDNEMSMTMMTW